MCYIRDCLFLHLGGGGEGLVQFSVPDLTSVKPQRGGGVGHRWGI